MTKFGKFWLTASIILLILIIVRLCMAPVLLYYVQKQINKIPDYRAKIADLDIHLYRGSYTIKNIQLWKISNKVPVPFFAANAIDLSVQWKALLKGKIVAKIAADHPAVNFVTDPRGNNEQLSIDSQWLSIVESLFPLNFNEITAQNGTLHFRSYSAKPPFDVYLKNLDLNIQNLQNINKIPAVLSSNFNITANTMDGAPVKIQGKFNPFDKQPRFYLTASVKEMNVKAIDKLLKHYTFVNVEGGKFSLYMEAASVKGKITGYAKPFIKNLKIKPITESANPIEAVYNGLTALVAKVLENHQQKTIATQINISGRIDDPKTHFLSVIGYIFRHAFIQALLPQIDHSVKMEDITYGHASQKIVYHADLNSKK